MNFALGIDVGGSGIKGARVDLRVGELLTERVRIPTPQPATPTAVGDAIAEIVAASEWTGPLGCTLPAVVQHGFVYNAPNLDSSWIGIDACHTLRERLGVPVHVLNDADAAGLAEMQFGAGRAYREWGVVLMLTFGTGIGSAIFLNGQLLPNTELGDLELDGQPAEMRAAARFREDNTLSWDQWIERVQRYLSHVELLFSPELIIFGGGISSSSDDFLPQLKTKARLKPAKLRNHAGIVGAALLSTAKEI